MEGLQFHVESLKNSVEECRCIKKYFYLTHVFSVLKPPELPSGFLNRSHCCIETHNFILALILGI